MGICTGPARAATSRGTPAFGVGLACRQFRSRADYTISGAYFTSGCTEHSAFFCAYATTCTAHCDCPASAGAERGCFSWFFPICFTLTCHKKIGSMVAKEQMAETSLARPHPATSHVGTECPGAVDLACAAALSSRAAK